MKKILFVVISLIIVLVLGEISAAYFLGKKAKKKFDEWVLKANQSDLFTYEMVSYDHGIFKSEIIGHIKLKQAADQKQHLTLKHVIFHGPIIIAQSESRPTSFQLAVIRSEPIEMLVQYSVPFISQTTLKFNGDIEGLVQGGKVNILDPALQITSPGWTSSTNIRNQGTDVQGNFSIPEFTVQAFGLPIVFKELKISLDQKYSAFGNWLGNFSFNIGDVVQTQQGAELETLKIALDTTLDKNQKIGVAWGISFNKIMIANVAYGPLNFQLELSNLDAEALGLSTSEKDKEAKNTKNEVIYQKLLLKRPKLTLKPSQFILTEGDIKGSIKIDGEIEVGGPDVTVPVNKDNIQSTIDGYFHAVVTKEILRIGLMMYTSEIMSRDPEFQKKPSEEVNKTVENEVNLKIQKFIQDGIMTETDREYEIKITILKGKWMVNGKEVEPLSPTSKIPGLTEKPAPALVPTPAEAPSSSQETATTETIIPSRPAEAASPAAGRP